MRMMTAICDGKYLHNKQSHAFSLEEALHECTCVSTHSKIVLKEHKAKCEIKNSDSLQVRITCLDPCVTMLSQKKKCDFIAAWEDKDNNTIVYYIELKASNHEKACKQLLETINYCKSIHGSCSRRCHIAAYPPVANATIQKYQKKFSKQNIELSANVALQAS